MSAKSIRKNSSPPDRPALERLLGAMVGCRIAVVGDAMLDAYVHGDVDRISPEAPVPVMRVERDELLLGGAANVAKALVALGAKVRLACIVGDDPDGRLCIEEAHNLGIDARDIVADPARPTTRKTRVVARHQQVIRLDRELTAPLSTATEADLVRHVTAATKWAQAVIISDYGKGALTRKVCRAVIRAAGKSTPVIVDPKDLPWDHFRGATLLKPNWREALQFAGQSTSGNDMAGRVARKLVDALGLQAAVVTRGGEGMTLAHHTQKKNARLRVEHFAASPLDLIDVTGAGDVVAATLAHCMAGGADYAMATWAANLAAGVKVSKFGAAAVTGEEMLDAADAEQGSRGARGEGAGTTRKIMTAADAATLADRARRQGKQVVFTNGCFDILHVGHVQYLQASRQHGDALIVGINTDASVRKLKGEGRPINHERDRAQILAAQACVDAVVLFDEDTPLELIRTIRPDVLTKGKDYRRKKDVVGWDIVEGHGGRVELIDLVKGKSTTSLIEKLHGGR